MAMFDVAGTGVTAGGWIVDVNNPLVRKFDVYPAQLLPDDPSWLGRQARRDRAASHLERAVDNLAVAKVLPSEFDVGGQRRLRELDYARTLQQPNRKRGLGEPDGLVPVLDVLEGDEAFPISGSRRTAGVIIMPKLTPLAPDRTHLSQDRSYWWVRLLEATAPAVREHGRLLPPPGWGSDSLLERAAEHCRRAMVAYSVVAAMRDCAAGLVETGLRARELYGQVARVVHRDVKPGNVLVDASGRIRLADFGHAVADDGESTITSRELRHPATEAYKSVHGLSEPMSEHDQADDIWSLGAVGWTLWRSRHNPYRGEIDLHLDWEFPFGNLSEVQTSFHPDRPRRRLMESPEGHRLALTGMPRAVRVAIAAMWCPAHELRPDHQRAYDILDGILQGSAGSVANELADVTGFDLAAFAQTETRVIGTNDSEQFDQCAVSTATYTPRGSMGLRKQLEQAVEVAELVARLWYPRNPPAGAS